MLEHEYTDDLADEELPEDFEIYEGDPDFDVSQTSEDDAQEDEGDTPVGMAFFAKANNAIRNFKEAIGWYNNHRTTSAIGFNPDNMCLKVCRTARNIPARYLTAKEAQDATPKEFRVYKIEDLRKGMVIYVDDPKDSNRAGHIVTQVGRVKGFRPKSMDDIIVETNSVKSGELVRVRLSYFAKHWGDKFQFGATWLNGVELDVPGRKSQVERFNNGGPVYNLNLLDKAAKAGRPKPGMILRRIEDQIRRLPDNRSLAHVREFKDEWIESRKIDLAHLDEAVKNGRTGLVKQVRDEIRRLISTLPDE